MTSVAEPSSGSRCLGHNRAGVPCARRAVKDGFCTSHHPTEAQDMKALGALGGRTPKVTALRRAAVEQDDSLREKARAALAEALDGADEKRKFEAAKSLFSYRPAEI